MNSRRFNLSNCIRFPMSQNRPRQDIQLVRISQEVAERLSRGRRVAHAQQSLPGQMQLTVTPPLSREPAAAYSSAATHGARGAVFTCRRYAVRRSGIATWHLESI
jgi:hypothetical protein